MFYRLNPATGRLFILAPKSSLAQEVVGTLDSEMVPGRRSCPISRYPSTAVVIIICCASLNPQHHNPGRRASNGWEVGRGQQEP